ncbi:MAG: nucleoside triphosphate pyrophosphohydrolase [Eubacteriaceae bacterium]
MKKIIIGGMGTSSIEHITLKTYNAILNAEKIFIRTKVHESAEDIIALRPDTQCFDEIYDKYDNFEEVYEKITDILIAQSYDADILYLVPGSPVFAEKTVELIVKKAECENIEVQILPSVSFVDAIFSSMKADAAHNIKILNALELKINQFDKNCVILICQVYDNFIASEIKLKLMEYYNENKILYIIHAGGDENANIIKTELHELDRRMKFDHMTSVYVPCDMEMNIRDMHSLEEIMDKLRSEGGCNWDRCQTHESLKRYIIEECYEVIDAIEKNDGQMLCEELGDVLLQVYFHASIAKEEELFDIRDVYEAICKKMINRHPHVFKAKNDFSPDKVEKEWEAIKLKEKGYKKTSESLIQMPKQLPALMYASRVQDKVKKAGFDFENVEQIYDKLDEELHEFIEALKQKQINDIKEEMGDLLFSIVNISRFLKIDSEEALKNATYKFIDRFAIVEELALSDGSDIKNINYEKADKYWNLSKIILKEKYKNEKK